MVFLGLRWCYLQTAQTWANAGVILLSRVSESTTDYTFTPCVGSFTSSGIDTRAQFHKAM